MLVSFGLQRPVGGASMRFFFTAVSPEAIPAVSAVAISTGTSQPRSAVPGPVRVTAAEEGIAATFFTGTVPRFPVL